MHKTILVTGGTGYIGSHTVVALVQAGYKPIIVDNLSNSSRAVLSRIEKICGVAPLFFRGDVRDKTTLDAMFDIYRVSAVIHFAGLKAVGESVAAPLPYYDNNVGGITTLLESMQRAQVRNFIFSSSATVYGDPQSVPIREDAALQVTNPYGRTKLMCEDILRDLMVADPEMRCAILRYFNPVGAHESGLMGESPNGVPNNLMPYITQTAVGKRDILSIYGNDYPTVDGTGVRDYIHVVDLAQGHVAALDYLLNEKKSMTVNLGTGKGVSVLELVAAFEQASGVKVPSRFVARRPGDIAACFADASQMKQLTRWEAKRSVLEMCKDAWRWQSQNPDGYQ